MAVNGTQTMNFQSNVDMSMVELKVLEITRAEWFGIAATATAKNPGTITGGTARY